jgi:tetratricopeptide (TPR) repeat protein
LRAAQALGDPVSLAHAEWEVANQLVAQGSHTEALGAATAAARSLESIGDLNLLGTTRTWIADMHLHAGRLAACEAELESACELAERTGRTSLFASAYTTCARWAFVAGDWPRALDICQRLAEYEKRYTLRPHFQPLIRAERGTVLLAQGADGAAELLQLAAARAEALPGAGPERAKALWAAHAPLAERELLDGDAASARARLEPLLGALADTPLFAACVEALLAWAYLSLGDLERAGSMLERGVARTRAEGYNLALVDLLRVQVLAEMRHERWEQAHVALYEGLALARGMPYLYAEAKLLYASGKIETACGNAAGARERFTDALALCERLGERLYRPHLERVARSVPVQIH